MATSRVLFVISNNPFSKDRRTVLKLLEELLKKNAEVVVFLHGNGVWWLGSDDLREMTLKGVKVYCGKDSAAKRSQPVPPWATTADLSTLVELVEKFDKVLFFN